MLRFQSYVLEKEGQLVYFQVPNNMMKGSQLREESQEFEKLFKLNKLQMEAGAPQQDKYSRSVVSSEMKSKQTSAEDLQKKIEALQKSLNQREERDWQPAHLLLSRCGIKDPHESKKVKPPMYFRESDQQRGYTSFEKRDVLNPAIE